MRTFFAVIAVVIVVCAIFVPNRGTEVKRKEPHGFASDSNIVYAAPDGSFVIYELDLAGIAEEEPVYPCHLSLPGLRSAD